MKKILLLLVTISISMSAMAKDYEFETKKNHISVNYCEYTVGVIDGQFENWETNNSWGGISITYTHNLSKRFELGGQVTLGGSTDLFSTTVMPVIGVDYYRNSWFKVSGEAGLGIFFNRYGSCFAYQAYPAVLRFGSDCKKRMISTHPKR